MLHVSEEEAVAKVISYLQDNPAKYPAIGHLSLVIANELGVAAAIVHIASKRITLGLASLEKELEAELATEPTLATETGLKAGPKSKKQAEEVAAVTIVTD